MTFLSVLAIAGIIKGDGNFVRMTARTSSELAQSRLSFLLLTFWS